DEHGTRWHFEMTPRRGHTEPHPAVRATQHHFYRDCVLSDVQALDLKAQVRESAEKLPVEGAHGVVPLVEFIVREEATCGPERGHDRVEVMGILDAEMLADGLDPSRTLTLTDRWHYTPPFHVVSCLLGPKQPNAGRQARLEAGAQRTL